MCKTTQIYLCSCAEAAPRAGTGRYRTNVCRLFQTLVPANETFPDKKTGTNNIFCTDIQDRET